MAILASGIKAIVEGIVAPVSGILNKRTERKMAVESADAKLAQIKQDGITKVELNEQDIEALRTKQNESTWKDEYTLLSVLSIMNIIVLGGIAKAFGFPEILAGVVYAVQELNAVGVDTGELIRVSVYAGLGLSVWKGIIK
tara:strand:- start:24086 stop:24508 length:423 start_codon:yes stop_codon:yes gene_type:complete